MSFFDKLKGDIGIEGEEKLKKPSVAKAKASKEKKPKKVKTEKPKKEEKSPKTELKEESPQEEGELAIDVYETNGDIVIQSTIGGIKAEDLDISIENDMVSIRGSRQKSAEEEGKNYFYQECYWGSFMRKVILPEEVDGSRAKATMKDGILTLKIPKMHRKTKRKIAVKQEE